MGLMDFFTTEGKRKRHIRRMTNRDAQPEDRETSAHWLAKDATPQAIYGLLKRFDMNLTQQLKDSAEKDLVYALLIDLGQPVLEPLDQWLKQCRQFTTPLRLHTDLAGNDATVAKVFELLAIELEKDELQPEKKHGLLVWLVEHKHPQAGANVAPFLKDFDENVRCSAAEVILGQPNTDQVPALLAALANPDEDSNRLRHRLATAFAQRRWSVGDTDLTTVLPEGFKVQNGFVIGS